MLGTVHDKFSPESYLRVLILTTSLRLKAVNSSLPIKWNKSLLTDEIVMLLGWGGGGEG